jgi:hypothetical protein
MTKMSDAAIVNGTKKFAFASWLGAVVCGLSSWVARANDLDATASILFGLVWLFALVFVLCWVVLAISALVLIFVELRRDKGT